MLANGTTTAEVKSGYGLTTASELRMLEAIDKLNKVNPEVCQNSADAKQSGVGGVC